MEKFKAKLVSMYKASGGKKADIISHSMGGILVKSFLALHHDVILHHREINLLAAFAMTMFYHFVTPLFYLT